MVRKVICFLIFISVISSCKKDPKTTPEIPAPMPLPNYKLKFLFVNRIGFRNDSTRHGYNDTVFQGPCIDGKYYNKKTNITTLSYTCYNRNYTVDNFPTTDSITFDAGIYDCTLGSKYGYQIELVWKCPTYPYTTKALRYTTKNFNAGDTIKEEKDIVVKFIWPDDTASGRYIKTYQWP